MSNKIFSLFFIISFLCVCPCLAEQQGTDCPSKLVIANQFLQVETRGGYIPTYASSCIDDAFTKSLSFKYKSEFSGENAFRKNINIVRDEDKIKVESIQYDRDSSEYTAFFSLDVVSPTGKDLHVRDSFVFMLASRYEKKRLGCAFVTKFPTRVYLKQNCYKPDALKSVYKNNRVDANMPNLKN